MNIRIIIKGIISYIGALAFATVFGLFLDANVGWFMLLALILAPLVSVFFAWLSSKLLVVSCSMENALLSKGDTCSMQVQIQNRSIFPTPPIEVKIIEAVGVPGKDTNLLVSVMSRETKHFELEFRAKICGKSTVGVESVRVTDYLGLFSFGVKKVDYTSLQRTVAVIPDIAEISARDDGLVKVMQTSLSMDDSDDTVEASSYSFGGFPGYDNRDYVPGDPLKRINWKQSAKRNRLLVRLDDEMASKTVNVVLDSVFLKSQIDFSDANLQKAYKEYEPKEIPAKIAEDAVENALGLMQVLLAHNYAVSFFAMNGPKRQFSGYEIADESDLEHVRMELAHYVFLEEEGADRVPKEDTTFSQRVCLFSTPNSYESAYTALERETEVLYTTIYSVMEESKKQNFENSGVSFQTEKKKAQKEHGMGKMAVAFLKPLVIPYILALLLSISIFTVFDVEIVSYWTILQAVVCAAIVIFCEFVNRHRIIGSLFITLLIMFLFRTWGQIAFSGDYGLTYMHWFMSAGESVETTSAYLLSLVVAFTVFFSMVVYYFVVVRYKTSYLLLVSLIPFVVYVKVMKEPNMTQVVYITALNIASFLVSNRIRKDKGKRLIGYVWGLVSVGVYATILIVIGLALPEAETKYYCMFENAFLGGNIREEVPQEYSEMSEFSGNADAFNELNNRKLYTIRLLEAGSSIYLKRQTFDLYDFEYDRWYPLDYYSETVYTPEEWQRNQENRNLSLLIQAMNAARQYEPGLYEEYGLYYLPESLETETKKIYVDTMNFSNVAYLTPPYTIGVQVQLNDTLAPENTGISRGGVFQVTEGFLDDYIEYVVEYYEESVAQRKWMSVGGTNYDYETSLQMLNRTREVLYTNGQSEYAQVVERYIAETKSAMEYGEACAENNEQIPARVKELALEITGDCTYDWEKADALQKYFKENNFVYDLDYKAPDDSVEYFLFEGKTGTCSDYASAYVLMARAVGLTVRYAEGFVPKEEYNGDFVVRTNCGHAYPEVFIPNVGYVVYEATLPANYRNVNRFGNTAFAYFLAAAVRVIVVFSAVSAVILSLLFIHLIAAPFVREVLFLRKVKKAGPPRAVVLIYKRIQKKHGRYDKNALEVNTPYEYAAEFEKITQYDVSELSYMVERAVYAEESLVTADKEKALEIYKGALEAIKEWRKRERKKK